MDLARIQGPHDPHRRAGGHRALQLCRRAGICRRQENPAEPTHPDELAEAGQRLEAPVAGGDQALSTAVNTSRSQKISNATRVMVPIQMQSYSSLSLNGGYRRVRFGP